MTRPTRLAAVLAAALTPGVAWAEGVRLGVFAGDPVALTLAIEAAPRWNIEASAGWSPGATRAGVLALGVAHDLMAAPVLRVLDGDLQPTLGLGLRLAFTREALSSDEAEVLAGVRVPVGLAWRRADLELYVEAAPGADLGARVRMSLEGGVGLRLAWF